MYEEIELLSVGGVWCSEGTTTENVVVDGIVCSRAATGRLATMDAGGEFAWEYLAGTDLKSALDYPNGARTEYTYESGRDLLTNVRNAKGGTVYSNCAYANDAVGRRTAKNGEQYGYNARSELVSAAGSGSYAYQYDDIGNRVTSSECGTNATYTANSLNQYTLVGRGVPSAPQEEFIPQYDLDGNQTLVKTSTGIWSVTYNGENRPIRWERGDTVITMDFDRLGRRTFYRETENGQQVTFTRFLYDGYLMIQQVFSNSPYNIYKEFVWDPTESVATKPLCFRQYGQSDAYLMHDGNKNVTDVIAASTAAGSLAHYDYAPFGAVRAQSGSRAAANPYRFSSEFADDTLGLVYYNYRHYDPTMGRWLSRDPIAENESISIATKAEFLMVSNNVVSQFDIMGQREWGPGGLPVRGPSMPPTKPAGFGRFALMSGLNGVVSGSMSLMDGCDKGCPPPSQDDCVSCCNARKNIALGAAAAAGVANSVACAAYVIPWKVAACEIAMHIEAQTLMDAIVDKYDKCLSGCIWLK